MLCDELKAYKADVTIPVYGSIADADVYLKKDVDAAIAELKEFAEDACLERDDNQTAIDELQAENAELKDKVKFCSDFELAARKDIEEMRGQHQMLKQFGRYKLSPVPGKMINHEVRQYVSYNVVCMIIKHLENENKELKQKLENVQASMYCDVVDAGMENRRLRRALWIARAGLCRRLDVDRYLRKHSNSWYNENCLTWNDACVAMEVKMCKAENKCRAKAEEYK